MRARAWGQAQAPSWRKKKLGLPAGVRQTIGWRELLLFAIVLVSSEFTLWGKNGGYEVREVRYFVVCLYMARFPLLSP